MRRQGQQRRGKRQKQDSTKETLKIHRNKKMVILMGMEIFRNSLEIWWINADFEWDCLEFHGNGWNKLWTTYVLIIGWSWIELDFKLFKVESNALIKHFLISGSQLQLRIIQDYPPKANWSKMLCVSIIKISRGLRLTHFQGGYFQEDSSNYNPKVRRFSISKALLS